MTDLDTIQNILQDYEIDHKVEKGYDGLPENCVRINIQYINRLSNLAFAFKSIMYFVNGKLCGVA